MYSVNREIVSEKVAETSEPERGKVRQRERANERQRGQGGRGREGREGGGERENKK